MAFIICVAALIIMMFVFTKMLLSFGNNSSVQILLERYAYSEISGTFILI